MTADGPKTRFEQSLAVLVGLTAVLASLLVAVQVDASRKSSRSATLSARIPVQLFADITVSGLYSDFHLNAARDAVGLGLSALARAQAGLASGAGFVETLALADYEASKQLTRAAQEMQAIDPSSAGVDPAVSKAMLVKVEELQSLVAEQGRQVDRYNRYSLRRNRSIFGLSLAAVAATLLGLAAVLRAGPGGRIALTAGAVALVTAAAWGGYALAA